MEFYYFGGNFNPGEITRLEKSHFDGVMFVYDAILGDVFTKVARDIRLNEKIKYLVAIRPYTISPQYLCMISKSINSIAPGRIQVNLISGYVKEHEKDFGGIIGDINDDSDRIDRSNYLIEYVKMLNTMPGNKRKHLLDFYVSTTNEYVFNEVSQNSNKMILPYRDYKNGYWTVVSEKSGQDVGNSFDISGQNIMLALTPIIRRTEEELSISEEYVNRPVWRDGEKTGKVNDIEFFTFQQFDDFMKKLQSEGINQVLINGFPEKERENIINFIKHYKELGLSKNSLPHYDHKDHRIS